MPNVAVVGAQWGDEGKGKVVDLLSERFDVVARFQGGPNAGHTITFEGRRHALHHIPSGVFRPSVRIVIGNGTVIALDKLLEEMEGLERAGVTLTDRLFISDRAHVILPPMARLDELREISGTGAAKIGTTKRGIGPAYETKAAREGIRVADLADESTLGQRIEGLIEGSLGRRLRDGGAEIESPRSMARAIFEQGRRIAPFVADTALLLNSWIDQGMAVLFEGAQGTLLDLDHGSYPFVTSSTTLAGGLCGGLGVSPRRIDGVVGIFKAYSTRVGLGPMPTELEDGPDGIGERIRRRGREYGTTTGRPRRCGWFDGVAASYAHRLNRFDGACVMLVDVLDDLEEIRICTSYRGPAGVVASPPASAADCAVLEPLYETFPGWRRDTSGVRRWDDLPVEARRYLGRLGEIVGVQVDLVSVGPDRTQTILRPGSWLERIWKHSEPSPRSRPRAPRPRRTDR